MAIPETMAALRVHAFGKAPRLDRVPLPAPGAGEVLVRLEATVIGHHDLDVAAGRLPAGQPLPFVPGLEGAGRVADLGTGAEFPLEARVRVFGGGLGAVRPGTWAEYVAAPVAAVTPVPEGMEPALAAACGSVANTAWSALQRGGLWPDDSLGVTGATGVVGSLVLQLAGRDPERRVVAWARAPERVPTGAEALRDDEDPDEPVDVLIDTVGGPLLPQRLLSVRPGGRAVLVGYTAGRHIGFDLPALLHGNVSLLPLNMRRQRVSANVQTHLLGDVADGRLAVATDVVGPSELNDAIARLKSGTAAGRVVLTW